MSDIITIGVIGLGNAGTPILNNLYKSKKYKLVAFDIDKNKLNDVPKDISKANSIKDLAQKCKAVLTCLPKPEHVLQAVDGKDGLLQNASSGMIWIDTSTTDFKQTQQLSEKAKTLASSCLDGSINPDDLTGATFTVTNLGSMGIESFTPVLNLPEVAILGICSINPKPVMQNEKVEFVPHMGLSLTFNHCALDGAPAARFLSALKKNIFSVDTLLTSSIF